MPPLNSWETFTLYNQKIPNQAHSGNIHFPPNGTADYDYANPGIVTSYASNWKRYPFLFQETELVSCETWGCDELGYLGWWYRHIPHFICKDQYNHLNNWWPYIVDYNEGKALERQIQGCDCDMFGDSVVHTTEPAGLLTAGVSPNPVTDLLQVSLQYVNNAAIQVRLYNPRGELMMEEMWQADPGSRTFYLPVHQLPTGIYFLQLTPINDLPQTVRFMKISL